MAATLNAHLDYFGATVRQAAELPRLARGGEVVLSSAVCADPVVAGLLAGRAEVFTADLPGAPGSVLQRVR
jgi:class 3 adenylate cyclase